MMVLASRGGDVRRRSLRSAFDGDFGMKAGLNPASLSGGSRSRELPGFILPVALRRSWGVLICMVDAAEDIFLGGDIFVGRGLGCPVAMLPLPFSCRRGVWMEIVAAPGAILEGAFSEGRTVRPRWLDCIRSAASGAV